MEYSKLNIVFYDGECGFCNSSLNFVASIDKNDLLHFVPLNTELSDKILLGYESFKLEKDLDSVVFLKNGKLYFYSTAILQIMKLMGSPWKYLYYLKYFPKRYRDEIYKFIARHRQKLTNHLHCKNLKAVYPQKFLS